MSLAQSFGLRCPLCVDTPEAAVTLHRIVTREIPMDRIKLYHNPG